SDRTGESQRVTHQLRRLLGPHVRTGNDGSQGPTGKLRGGLLHLLATVAGELAGSIARRLRLGLTMAQQPKPHSLGSSSRTGCGTGGMSWAVSPSGARGVGQSAKGQGFSSVLKVPKRPICARYWLRLSPKPSRPAFGAP